MTRIVALLSWYDESPQFLADMVTGLQYAEVDHLVAVDGAYALYPGGHPRSDWEQHDAIKTAAGMLGLPLTVHVPTGLWAGNECEKRTCAFRLGDEQRPDWFLVIDADEVIVQCPKDLKDRLAATEKDYADVSSLEQAAPVWFAGFEEDDIPGVIAQRFVKPRRCLVRAVPGIVVGPSHYDYVTPDGRNLWGDEYRNPLRVADMVIDHRSMQRNPDRKQRFLDYCQVRNETRAEPVGYGVVP